MKGENKHIMSTKNVFSTPRPNQPTVAEMLESLIQKKNQQMQNRKALNEARKLPVSQAKMTATLEAAEAQAKKQFEQDILLEQMAARQGKRNIALEYMRLKPRVIQEGMDYVTNKVLGELIFECYWLDDDMKFKTVDGITDNIANVLGYIEESFQHAKVPIKQSKLLENIIDVIKETVDKASERLCQECGENGDSVYSEFELTEAEEDELDNKLSELGRDEIVDLVKDKVMRIVQDEKKQGQERSEMFEEIDKSISDDDSEGKDEPDEEVSDTEESVMFNEEVGRITLEGANWDVHKIWFSGEARKANNISHLANQLYYNGKYKDAEKYYNEAISLYRNVKKKIEAIPETLMSDVLSQFTSIISVFMFGANAFEPEDWNEYKELMKGKGLDSNYKPPTTWNATKEWAINLIDVDIQFCNYRIDKCRHPESIVKESVIMEGANWDTLKVYYSNLRKRASNYAKEGNRLYKMGQYEEAAKKYKMTLDIFKDLKERIRDIDDDLGSTVISWFLSYFTQFTAFTDIITTRGGATFYHLGNASTEFDTWNSTKLWIGANINKMIAYCEKRIDDCERKAKEEKTGKTKKYKYDLDGNSQKKYKYNLETMKYSPDEKRMAYLLESGSELGLFNNPVWDELKAFISLNSKTIIERLSWCKNVKTNEETCDMKFDKYQDIINYLTLIEDKLANMPEDVPADIKEYIMTMIDLIYIEVPSDEVIICRFGKSLGSPDIKANNPVINWESISWNDLFTNIKTNFALIKNFCKEKADCAVIDVDSLNDSECPDTGANSLAQKVASPFAQLIATNQTRSITRSLGNSLFEAIMIGCMKNVTAVAMESSNEDIDDETIEDTALIEALLYSTVFETLDTIGMYKFRSSDVDKIKQRFMMVTEAINEKGVKGINTNKKLLSLGKGKGGLKKVRINTTKMMKKKPKNISANSDIIKGNKK